MRKALLAGLVIVVLGSAAPANAGCWATVGLTPPPAGTSAGDVWNAKLTVLQHGRNPLPDARTATPKLTIVNRATGQRKTFKASATNPAKGVYTARVVFPGKGAWRYEVYDGFTSAGGEAVPCARTHTFAGASIGGSDSSSGAWPLAGGLVGLGLVAAAAFAYVVRRRSSRPVAAPVTTAGGRA